MRLDTVPLPTDSGYFLKREMAKTTSNAVSSSSSEGTPAPKDIADRVNGFFSNVGVSSHIPEDKQSKDFYSNLLTNIVKVDQIQRGSISCNFTVLPLISNYFGGLHGAALAAVAERVAIACASTLVAEDKDTFLAELALSYLSAAPKNAEIAVDASVLRSGKNVTAVAVEFRIKKTRKLAYTARATFFHMPVSKL